MEIIMKENYKIMTLMVSDSITQFKMEPMKGCGRMDYLKDKELLLINMEIY